MKPRLFLPGIKLLSVFLDGRNSEVSAQGKS